MYIIDAIKKNHGGTCSTHTIAQQYEKEAKRLYGLDKPTEEKEELKETLKEKFLNKIIREYRKMLQEEYNYKTSREAIIETFEANEYDFTTEGKID